MFKWLLGAPSKRRDTTPPIAGAADAEHHAPAAVESCSDVPTGFVPYSVDDFQKHFGVSPAVGQQIANDYADLLGFEKKRGFGAEVRANPRDGALVGRLCSERYDASGNITKSIALYFMFVAIAREHQVKARDLKITKAKWTDSHATVPPCHPGFDGRAFNPQKGIRIKGRYVLPGVTLGCKCNSRAIFEF
jgi:hypothetical protein